MYEQPANADNCACSLGTLHRVSQQGQTDALSLPRSVYGQTPKNGHWDWVRHVATDAAWGITQRQGARR